MPIEASSGSETLSERYGEGCIVTGKYRLERLLGEGGMGLVWAARNLALDVDVAIKLIRSGLKAEDAADRLLKEARAAAKTGHAAIVRVFDFGRTELGDPFIVMELLHGRPLSEVLERHVRITPVRAVQTLLPVIDALGCAHDHGIVHRDLKPENIFLASSPGKRTQPKVVDFGIAKLVGAGDHTEVLDGCAASVAAGTPPARTSVARAALAQTPSVSRLRHVTRDGSVLGSPGYMAPEQARGSLHVDHHADVWAVCVVLYEAMTGTPAFLGDNHTALMRAIIEDTVTPITDVAAGDAALWNIISKGLEKAPERRWSSMRDLGQALAAWLLDHGITEDITGQDLQESWFSEGAAEHDVFSSPVAAPAKMLANAARERDTTPGGPAFEDHPRRTPTRSSVPATAVISVKAEPRARHRPVAIAVTILFATAMAAMAVTGSRSLNGARTKAGRDGVEHPTNHMASSRVRTATETQTIAPRSVSQSIRSTHSNDDAPSASTTRGISAARRNPSASSRHSQRARSSPSSVPNVAAPKKAAPAGASENGGELKDPYE